MADPDLGVDVEAAPQKTDTVARPPPSNGNEASLAAFGSRLEQYRYGNSDERSKQVSPHKPITRSFGLSQPVNASARRDNFGDGHSSPSKKATVVQPHQSEQKDDISKRGKKRRRESSRYAPPSKYAHLPTLQDVLAPGLICVFVGTNPGIRTATAGHAYAHPSNLFWKLLHSSGCTDERLRPEQDVDLPRLYSMGNTNIVERPSKDAAELSKAEMAAGTPILEDKVAKYRPEAVCIVGKGIWEAIWRWRYKREIRKDEFRYGWQDDKERMGRTDDWEGAPVFVASSTSGLSASLRPHEKEAVWRPFGQWVKKRREERRAGENSGSVDD